MRLNEVGYPVLNDQLHQTIFGSQNRPLARPDMLERTKGLLSKFGIKTPVDYPDNLYDGPLPLPPLPGVDIEDTLEAMADEFVGDYIHLARAFAECKLPKVPGELDIVFQPGWTRYAWEKGRWVTEQVNHPLEKVFVYDCETFVEKGAFPIIGTAMSCKAAYVWLADEMVDPSLLNTLVHTVT